MNAIDLLDRVFQAFVNAVTTLAAAAYNRSDFRYPENL
jgi:hypothetical protein